MNLHRITRIGSVPACNHDCSQGRGDCPTPEACRLPDQVQRQTGANLPTWRAQIHETADQAEQLLVRVGLIACVAGTAVLIFAPADWLLALGAA